jgi:hypothetical protein
LTDLSQLSDADLQALYSKGAPSPDVPAMVASEAVKQGVDPVLALGVARQESGFRPDAVSPAGAVGPMQLMPDTARDLRVNPHDPVQNVRGGVAYLKQQLDRFGDPKLAAAAYNAGPGAVREHGGVPPYPETQAYVASVTAGDGDLSKLSDDELRALYGATAGGATPEVPATTPAPIVVKNAETGQPYNDAQQRTYADLIQAGRLDTSATPGSEAFPRGLTDPNDKPKPGDFYVDLDGNVKQAPGLAEDVAGGLMRGGEDAANGIADTMLEASPAGAVLNALSMAGRLAEGQAPRAAAPASILSRSVAPMEYVPQTRAGERARTLGVMLPNAAVPGGAIRRAAAVALPAIGSEVAGETAEDAGANPALTSAARFVGGLSGGATAGLGAARAALPRPPSVPALKRASDQAWELVDASGYRFPQADVKSAAADIRAIVDDAGPDLYENAARVANRVEALADRGELTPAQANRLRSQVGEKLLGPKSDEVSVGRAIRDRIEALIDSASDQSAELRDARAKYSRYLKMKDVTDRLEDAKLNQASSGTGGNLNAQRQALKPLVKSRSAQRMRNATPQEMAAMRRVVSGGPIQNAARVLSAFDPTHGRLGAMLQGLGLLPTHGLSLLTIPAGMAGTATERAIARANIERLLNTIGGAPREPAIPSVAYDPQFLTNAPLNLGSLLEASRAATVPAPTLRRPASTRTPLGPK